MIQLSTNSIKFSNYSILAIMGLLFFTISFGHEGFGFWTFLPFLAGLFGLLFKGTITPSFVLLLVVCLLLFQRWFRDVPLWDSRPINDLSSLAITFGCLIYAISHFRDLFINSKLTSWKSGSKKEKTTSFSGQWLLDEPINTRNIPSTNWEIIFLAIKALTFSLISFVIWTSVRIETPPEWFELPVPLWRIFILFWAIALLLLSFHTFSTLLRYYLSSQEEAVIYLQDIVWKILRGEQRLINRFIQRKNAANKVKQ